MARRIEAFVELAVSPSSLNRLHLATRIHLTLLRELGEGIDVRRMLRDRDYADEVLHVCEGIDDLALLDLAERFGEASAAEDAKHHMAQAAQRARVALAEIPRRGAAAPTEMPWSRNTSGFGLSRPLAPLDSAPVPMQADKAAPSLTRLAPAWLRLPRLRGARH